MNEEGTFAQELYQRFRQTNTIHWNLEQVVIVTTEDKLRLCLQNAIDRLDAKWKWWTPLATLLTLVLALTTTEFKDQFTIPAATWQAIFLILTGASLIWAVVAIWRAIRVKISIESIVSEIKQQPTEKLSQMAKQ